MTLDIEHKTVAMIATDGFEQSELLQPKDALETMGINVDVISINSSKNIRAWDAGDWGQEVKVDKQIEEVKPADYDGVVLPGGQINPDILRTNAEVVEFIKVASKTDSIKVIAAICHAPWLLAEAGIIKDKQATSYHSIKTDIENAGANWKDESVVIDGKLVTSRNPDDIPNFVAATIQKLIS